MKKGIAVLISTLLMGFASGCSINGSVEEMMKPPKLSINQEEVKNILNDVLSPEAELKMPIEGESTSAIQFVNLDEDEEAEVLVFYILENDETPLRTLILDKGEQWNIIDGIKGIGTDFDRVKFKDITGDESLEIIIGYRGEGFFENKGLSIYEYNDGEVKEIFNNFYSDIAAGDLDKDGIAELVLMKSDREKGTAKAELHKYTDNGIKKINETKMEAFAHYSHIVIGKASEDKVGVFVDEGVGAHSGLTELLIMDNGKLKNVFFDEEKGFNEKTFKAYQTKSEDIDKDGIIELALLRAPIGYEDASMAGTPWIHTWYNWDGENDLIYKSESYFNYYSRFYFNFPEKWDKNITIDNSDADPEKDEYWVTFSYLKEEDGSKHPLFTIKSFNAQNWEEKQKEYEDKEENYFELGKNVDKIYIGVLENSIEEDSIEDESTEENSIEDDNIAQSNIYEMQLDKDEIKLNFNVIE